MKKILTAYFSASGVTREAASRLSRIAGSDLYEIRPLVPYTEEDLDWRNKQSRSSVEMQDPSSRPELADHDADIKDHDLILLGFPIWWYTAPMIIRTFLEAYDFSGKTIVLFATSGGSQFGDTAKTLQTIVPDSKVIDGMMIRNSTSDEEIKNWVSTL